MTETVLLTKDQHDFCISEANKLAKILMEEDTKNIFHEDGNAFFCLQTLVYLTSGIISLCSKKINVNHDTILSAFLDQVKMVIKEKSERKLHLVN